MRLLLGANMMVTVGDKQIPVAQLKAGDNIDTANGPAKVVSSEWAGRLQVHRIHFTDPSYPPLVVGEPYLYYSTDKALRMSPGMVILSYRDNKELRIHEVKRVLEDCFEIHVWSHSVFVSPVESGSLLVRTL